MRISDWSSDVCSSDLGIVADCAEAFELLADLASDRIWRSNSAWLGALGASRELSRTMDAPRQGTNGRIHPFHAAKAVFDRSEERRVGKEWVRTCRSRG